MTDAPPRLVLRSFMFPAGVREGTFRADVHLFLGIAPVQNGCLIAAVCEEPEVEGTKPSGLVNASGQLLAVAKDAQEWSFHLRADGELPPPLRNGEPAQYIGCLGAQTPQGVTGIFVFVQKKVGAE
jgi:hypothetical protein